MVNSPFEPVTPEAAAKALGHDVRTVLKRIGAAGIKPVTSRRGKDGRVLARYNFGDIMKVMDPEATARATSVLESLFSNCLTHPGAPFLAIAGGSLRDRYGLEGPALVSALGEIMLAIAYGIEGFMGYGPGQSSLKLELHQAFGELMDSDEVREFIKAHPYQPQE
ncbi:MULTISPECIES: hypothetical protein [unclassified Methylococcus]|uniref:hypothetical protein n=1 Tax=unclassified Methylococcus TaxID=2618889 RepID=UPI003D7D114E